MRLIDADELVKLLKANTMSNGTLINTNTMIAVVEKMPTAYEIEKVVEELDESFFQVEQLVDEDGYKYKAVKVVELDMAIDIVRRGGVE